MACKSSIPQARCGECRYIDRDTYRGAGKEVCYELQYEDNRKVAVEVSETKKACNKFSAANKIGRAVGI